MSTLLVSRKGGARVVALGMDTGKTGSFRTVQGFRAVVGLGSQGAARYGRGPKGPSDSSNFR